MALKLRTVLLFFGISSIHVLILSSILFAISFPRYVVIHSPVISASKGCPKDVMLQVKQCMNPLEMYTVDQGGIFMFMSSLDKTSQLCSDGKIQNAFSCLNKLYNKCAKSKEGTHHFDLLVDVGKWRQAVDNICNNIHYLQDHQECEVQAYVEYKPCADEEVRSFSAQISTMWTEIGIPGHVSEDQRTETVMDIGCSFTVNILECLKKPFTKYCPIQLTNLLVNTVEDFMPPACAKRALINSINKIPRYKHMKQEKLQIDNKNINSTYIVNEVVIGTSTQSTTDNVEMIDKDTKEELRQIDEKIVEPPPGKDGTKEAIGAARSSEGDLDNGSCFINCNLYATTFILVTTRIWLRLKYCV